MNRLELFPKLVTQIGLRPLLLLGMYRLGILTGHYRRLDSRLIADAARAGAFRPVYSLPNPDTLRHSLSKTTLASIRREADAVVRGKVRMFGDRLAPLQLSPAKDLRHWTDYERDPIRLSSFSMPHGDVKFLWESARFGWAYALGRMFHLSRREEYARAFWKYFDVFDKANPAYVGPHWMNGQEVAIRLMALLWAAHVLAPAGASTPRRLARLTRAIAVHAARIPPTLVYARSQNNNHLVTEAAALFLAGTTLGHGAWRELGWKWLNRALQGQIGSYGEYIQHSANYHRLMLHSVLMVEATRRGTGQLWPARTQSALARASHWLFSMLDPASGRVPNLGANDGSLILPLSACEYDDFRPTVQAAARCFLRTSLAPGAWDDLALWLGLPRLHHTAESVAYAAEHLRSKDSWAYLRASAWKSRLSHMDQLHLDLWWRGQNIAADPGTYLYNGAPPWDNPLVSSRVHNCLTIDGREQMLRGGRFLVLDWFPAYSQHQLSARAPILGQIRASHNGFASVGLAHQRTLNLMDSGTWQIRDDLAFTRRGRHMVRLHWLLLDGAWRLRQAAAEVRLQVHVRGGWVNVSIVPSGSMTSALKVRLVRAGKVLRGDGRAQPWDGWMSPTYGRKLPALSLSVEAEAFGNCALTTEFHLPA